MYQGFHARRKNYNYSHISKNTFQNISSNPCIPNNISINHQYKNNNKNHIYNNTINHYAKDKNNNTNNYSNLDNYTINQTAKENDNKNDNMNDNMNDDDEGSVLDIPPFLRNRKF